jgi:hypothetical protein
LTEEEDHKSIMIIRGIRIFLPRIPIELSAHFKDAAKEGQPTKIVKGKIEQTLTSTQVEMKGEEEHTDKMLTHWEKELKLLEDWLGNPGTKGYFPRDTVVKNGDKFQSRRLARKHWTWTNRKR